MAIELTETYSALVPAQTVMSGENIFNVAAGKTLTIETAPAGVEYLSKLVPTGKSWRVSVNITIVETNI